MPTTSLKALSTEPAEVGSASSTLASTVDSRTIEVTGPILVPETATPRAQATSSTAPTLSAAPPSASSARTGCQVMRDTDPRADVLQQRLAEGGGEDDDEQRADRDQQGRGGVTERQRRQPDAEQAAAQQPGGREDAGDEALPISGQGVEGEQDHQDPVERVHRVRRSSSEMSNRPARALRWVAESPANM